MFHDKRDPLSGIINKSIELAQEIQILWNIDDKQMESLSKYIRLMAICEVNKLKAEGIYHAEEISKKEFIQSSQQKS